jgi:hypothetical protein
MDEMERLPLLIQAVLKQTIQHFRLVVCVNQPEAWWQDANKQSVCIENQLAIKYLYSLEDKRIEILDKSSPGKGWPPK